MAGRLATYLGSTALAAIGGAIASPVFGRNEKGEQNVHPLQSALLFGSIPSVVLAGSTLFPGKSIDDIRSSADKQVEEKVERDIAEERAKRTGAPSPPTSTPLVKSREPYDRVYAQSRGSTFDYKVYSKLPKGRIFTPRSKPPQEVIDFMSRIDRMPGGKPVVDPELGLVGIKVDTGRKDGYGRNIVTHIVTDMTVEPDWHKSYLDEIEALMARLDSERGWER